MGMRMSEAEAADLLDRFIAKGGITVAPKDGGVAYKNKDGRVMASLVEVFDYLDFLGAL